MSNNPNKPGSSLSLHMFLVVLSLTMIAPFAWMLLTSLKTLSEVGNPGWLPAVFQWENYAEVFRTIPFLRWMGNSLVVAGWVTLLQVITSSMAAFSFARLDWPGRDRVFFLYLGTMMLPGLVMLIPNFENMVKFHLVDTYLGLILPAAFSAFGTFLLRQFMLGIPKSYDEAAEMDGASKWQIFWDVILPLSRPGMVTLAIFTFIGNFQSFFWPLVMTKSVDKYTLPVGLLFFNTERGQATHLLMASVTMSVVPLIIVFVLLQRQLIKGIQLGGVKVERFVDDMKRVLLVVLLVLSASSLLLYWTQPDRHSAIPVLYWVTQNDPVKRETILLFKQWLSDNNLPPVEVKIDNANQDPTKKLAQGLAGVGADLFDIYSTQNELFASSGMLMDVTEQAVELGFSPEATYPALLRDIVHNDRQFGFPRNVASAVCWLNTETFARYRIPEPNYRWTWDEFEDIGKKFVTAANPPGSRERSYFITTVSLIDLRRGLGLSIFNETMTKCILDDPRNTEVMRRYNRWVVELHLIPTLAEQSAMSANASLAGEGLFYLFAKGRYAMIYMPRYALIRLRVQGDLPLRAVEVFHSGFPNTEFVCGIVSVYTGSKHPVEAVRFLQFLTSEPFNMLIARSGDALPPVPKYVHTEEFLRPPDHPNEWEAQKVFTRVAPEMGIAKARSPFVISGVVARADLQISQSVIAGQLTPEDAGRAEALQLNGEIARNIRSNEKLRKKYDELIEVQKLIDERRAQGLPVPLEWITNPFHRTYYKAMGWLEEESKI